jgi:hypothetical protein
MLIAGKIEVPDECPKNCKYRGEPFYQGNACSRCPIFNCKRDDEGICLIEPEDYREDWAIEWKKFFDTGKEPKLYLKPNRERGK